MNKQPLSSKDLVQNKRTPSVVMVSPVNFLRAYSGFQYLGDLLAEQGCEIEILAAIPPRMMAEARSTVGHRVQSYRAGWRGRLPKLWRWEFRAKLRRLLGQQPDLVIVNCTNPAGLTREVVQYRQDHPDSRLVLYCPEIWLPGEPTHLREDVISYYRNHVGIADLVIDVEPTRAELRKQHFDISDEIAILPNTMPRAAPIRGAKSGALLEHLGLPANESRKVLLFTGPARHHTIEELGDTMKHVSDEVMLAWFCHGDQQSVEVAQKLLSTTADKPQCVVRPAIPRRQLLSMSYQADAGLIVYPCRTNKTQNQRHAAPSKLYEFLAAGLPIASYGNPGIRRLVDEFEIGECASEETPESLAEAINRLFAREDFPALSSRCATVFSDHLCYENYTPEITRRLSALTEHQS